MRIKTPKFVRRMVCKYLEKIVEDEVGIRMDVEIENMTFEITKRDYCVHMSETISIDKRDFKRFIKENMKKGA